MLVSADAFRELVQKALHIFVHVELAPDHSVYLAITKAAINEYLQSNCCDNSKLFDIEFNDQKELFIGVKKIIN